LQLLHLVGSFDLLMQRMAARKSHYMPASLLHSQFADLQPPDADERAQLFEVTQTPQRIVQDFAIAGSRAYTGH
jgi:gluconokinase